MMFQFSSDLPVHVGFHDHFIVICVCIRIFGLHPPRCYTVCYSASDYRQVYWWYHARMSIVFVWFTIENRAKLQRLWACMLQIFMYNSPRLYTNLKRFGN